MGNYYVKRLISTILTILLIASITFFMMKIIPGGPFTRERPVSPEILENLEEQYNLNDPLIVQYFDYMWRVVTFDFGLSFKKLGYSVNDLILLGLPYSALVGGLASLVIIAVGIPIGIVSALKQNSIIDYLVMFAATIGVTLPSFVIATFIIYTFGVSWEILPVNGYTTPLHYVGPVIALSGYSLSFVARLTRSSMLEVLRQDYVRTARANGISEYKVIFKHALKNALIPVITYIGPMIAAILTGSFVIERMFQIPGIGRYFIEGIQNRDYTVIMGMTVFYAAFYVVMILLVDVLYSLIDPRIKLEG